MASRLTSQHFPGETPQNGTVSTGKNGTDGRLATTAFGGWRKKLIFVLRTRVYFNSIVS